MRSQPSQRRALAISVALLVGACTGPTTPTAAPTDRTATEMPAPTSTAVGAVAPAAPARTSLAASITDATAKLGWPDQRANPAVQRTVPVADKIAVRAAGQDRWEVIGSAGAISGLVRQRKPRVRVLATEWRSDTCVEVRPDGSFSAVIDAGPGSTLIIVSVDEGECSGFTTNATGALVLRTPEGVSPGTTMAFAASGGFEASRWVARGELLGSAPRIRFDLRAGGPARCLSPRLHVHRLFDQDGEYVTSINSNVYGPVLTPTGLPIETGRGPDGFWSRFSPAGARCLADGMDLSLAGWSAGLEPGWYRPRIALYDPVTGHLATDRDRPDPASESFSGSTEVGYLPLVRIGEAKPPKLPASFLNEEPSWGSAGIRGVQAKEDLARFALASRRAAQGPFIASKRDPLTGALRSYLLEPFLPTLSHTGFGNTYQRTPLLAFDPERPGSISLTMRGPDGTERALAKDAPVRRAFLAGGTNSATVPLSFAGPNRTYGLLTDIPDLDVRFAAYGLHTLSLAGTLRTVWGQEIVLRGTYEIWVAEPLQLTIGTFQGTPLEVGQQYSPVVSVRPGVPADVTIHVDHFVDGDADKKRTHRVSGRANAYGYFVARDRWTPEAHGEYIARVEARYLDPIDKVLWMATRTGASIVATPDSPLIGHGQRNARLADIKGDGSQRTWFFNRSLDPACGEATCESAGRTEARSVENYPYHRGDVAWIADVAPITPRITLEDPSGALSAAGFAFRPRDDQISVVLPDGGNRPRDIDRWMYWYSSALRPDDVSIFHAVSDGSGPDHQQWYGNDSYNCQIGLTCLYIWDDFFQTREDRNGDEEGDIKVFFGGMVVKAGAVRHFVPYASMGVIIPEALRDGEKFRFRDEKGQRICPPFQGAAGGLATCGPLLTIGGLPFDLFVTPTGTRPGSILQVGDRFVFSGLAWPTLDVAYEVTVRDPAGRERSFRGRASRVGYIDGKDAEFEVSEPGIHTVRVSLVQDRPVPSTGLAPTPALVADGRTVQKEHSYERALSAILGSADSTYEFYVGEPAGSATVATGVELRAASGGRGFSVPKAVTLGVDLGASGDEAHYILTIPGLVVRSGVWEAGERMEIRLDEQVLYRHGYTNVILGADSLDLSVIAKVGGKWIVKSFNLRGLTPFGGAPITFR